MVEDSKCQGKRLMILKLHLDAAEQEVRACMGVCVFSSVTPPVSYF